jgi:hypothetical protein
VGQVALPLGRDMVTGEYSPFHKDAAKFEDPVSVRVKLKITPRSDLDKLLHGELGVPAGEFTVFDGYAAQPGYDNTGRSAGMVLPLAGWQVKLAEASCLSRSSHPSNRSWFALGALSETPGSALGNGDLATGTQADEFISPGTVAGDFWGSALYRWFDALCRRTPLWQFGDGRTLADEINAEALAALARLGPGVAGYRPIKLDLDANMSGDLAFQISSDVSAGMANIEGLAHSTLWDVLAAKIAPSYKLAVVPRVSSGVVVPYVPAYRGDGGVPYGKIRAYQATSERIGGTASRPLRAYGVLAAMTMASDAQQQGGAGAVSLGVGGFYDSGRKGGVVMISGNEPQWVSQLFSAGALEGATGGINFPTATALHPEEGAGAARKSDAADRDNRGRRSEHLLNALAQCGFAEENLRGRSGQVDGPLRFDLAPGSTTSVVVAG